jgi:hypothetical protein
MGQPGIDTITRGLRAKAAELAVYLACHPDGAAVRDAAEYLLPDVTLHAADQQIHTNASNLRQTLAKVGGRLLKQDGRYRLDPSTVTVDVWQLRQTLRAVSTAEPTQRRQLLQDACELCVGPLAEGQAYEWVEPHAEAVRRWATKARRAGRRCVAWPTASGSANEPERPVTMTIHFSWPYWSGLLCMDWHRYVLIGPGSLGRHPLITRSTMP